MNFIYLDRLSTTVHQGLFPPESLFLLRISIFLYIHFLWNKAKGIQQGLDVFVNLLLIFFFCLHCLCSESSKWYLECAGLEIH